LKRQTACAYCCKTNQIPRPYPAKGANIDNRELEKAPNDKVLIGLYPSIPQLEFTIIAVTCEHTWQLLNYVIGLYPSIPQFEFTIIAVTCEHTWQLLLSSHQNQLLTSKGVHYVFVEIFQNTQVGQIFY